MQLNPYVTFDGNGVEALNYYAEILGGKVGYAMTFGEMPDSPDWVNDANRDRLAHGAVVFAGGTIMVSDTAGFEPFEGYKGMTLQVSVDSFDEGAALFEKISQDGDVKMPYSETFWAKGFGMCADKFGVSWMVNCDNG